MEPIKFGDELKKILLAGIGAAATTAEKSKELLDQLVEKGELTVEQGKVMNEELKRNIKDAVQEATGTKKDTGSLIDALDTMTPEELQAIKDKLARMESETVDVTDVEDDE